MIEELSNCVIRELDQIAIGRSEKFSSANVSRNGNGSLAVGYPPCPRSTGIINLRQNREIIYGAQLLTGKILSPWHLARKHPIAEFQNRTIRFSSRSALRRSWHRWGCGTQGQMSHRPVENVSNTASRMKTAGIRITVTEISFAARKVRHYLSVGIVKRRETPASDHQGCNP